jgi:fructokinase
MDAYRMRIETSLDLANIIKLSEEDVRYIDPNISLEGFAQELLRKPNCALVIITLGAEGSLAFNARASVRAPIYPATPGGDNVGAGDTLMAAVLTWLNTQNALAPDDLAQLDADQLTDMLWFGAVAAGINCSRVGANPPTLAEVEAMLGR